MKFIALDQATANPDFGGKINGLVNLIASGFTVPEGFILTSQDIQELVIHKNPDYLRALSQEIDPNKIYIVRSSAYLEDGSEASFAGQYQSVGNCQGTSSILQAINICLQAAENTKLEAYLADRGLTNEVLRLALLIQEQVAADVSGVSFTCHPSQAEDQLWMVEYVEGLGEQLVSGQKAPYSFCWNWFDEIEIVENQLLSNQQLEKIRNLTLSISQQAGKPMDIEFCLSNQEIYFLQARPMTRLSQVAKDGRWTTANYRDGGVAAQSCPNLMWSLYRYSWQTSLEAFLLQHHLVKKEEFTPLIKLCYARPYWNLGMVKKAMEQIPGYIEQEFDDELGVEKNYQGIGYKSRWTPSSISHLLHVAFSLNKTTKEWQRDNTVNMEKLFLRYHELEKQLAEKLSLEQIGNIWIELITKDYLQAEKSYFWQVFINTVQLSLKKNQLLKWMQLEEFLVLIADLGNVSHLKPMIALRQVGDMIQSNPVLLADWESQSPEMLLNQLSQEREDMMAIREFLTQYGYHSERELNLLEFSFIENPLYIIQQLQQMLRQPFQSTIFSKNKTAELQTRLGARKWNKVQKEIAFLRDLLWWREEWKDISTRYYHLIRQWTIKLADAYREVGYLEEYHDLFYCQWEEIKEYIEEKISLQELLEKIKKNQLYCQIYREANVPEDLFDKGSVQSTNQQEETNSLYGLNASSGLVQGTVRVLEYLEDLQKVQPGEILVTRYTDTGWTPVFSKIAGLVTETGGILCHASIVAREYGIPALVCVKGAREQLKTGMFVTLNTYEQCLTIESKENDDI
ncbi:PEP/pyruvate-binding domain-containing protein [Streptococcus suis]